MTYMEIKKALKKVVTISDAEAEIYGFDAEDWDFDDNDFDSEYEHDEYTDDTSSIHEETIDYDADSEDSFDREYREDDGICYDPKEGDCEYTELEDRKWIVDDDDVYVEKELASATDKLLDEEKVLQDLSKLTIMPAFTELSRENLAHSFVFKKLQANNDDSTGYPDVILNLDNERVQRIDCDEYDKDIDNGDFGKEYGFFLRITVEHKVDVRLSDGSSEEISRYSQYNIPFAHAIHGYICMRCSRRSHYENFTVQILFKHFDCKRELRFVFPVAKYFPGLCEDCKSTNSLFHDSNYLLASHKAPLCQIFYNTQ